MANDIKNVFISHVHEDDAGLGELKEFWCIEGQDHDVALHATSSC